MTTHSEITIHEDNFTVLHSEFDGADQKVIVQIIIILCAPDP
jgi:hypothetical protein